MKVGIRLAQYFTVPCSSSTFTMSAKAFGTVEFCLMLPKSCKTFDSLCCIVTTNHTNTYTCKIHIDAIIKTSDTVLGKIYLSLYLKGLCVWEGVGDWTNTATCWPSQPLRTSPCVVLVLLGCSTGGLGAQPLWDMFSSQHLLTNWSPNSIRGPKGPFCRVVAFSTTSCL